MKRIAFSDIKEATRGAVCTEEIDGALVFHRFSADEREKYPPYDFEKLALKMPSSSGVTVVFETDATELSLSLVLRRASSRQLGCALDVLVDGKLVATCARREPPNESGCYALSETVALPKGEKRVTLVLPGLFSASIRSLSLSDGASFKPIKAKRRLLIYGDSITQGYDASSPSNAYASRIALALDADATNKAIGGEIYFPPLAEMDSGVENAALILIAYGTNDWSHRIPLKELIQSARAFYTALRARHPLTPICVLSPIWRADAERTDTFPFRSLPDALREAASGLPGVSVVDCFAFVPKDTALFADGSLHPNDEGFAPYTEGVLRALHTLYPSLFD